MVQINDKFTTDKVSTNDGPWHDTPPSSTTITLGGGGTNDSGNTPYMLCSFDVAGLQSRFHESRGSQL